MGTILINCSKIAAMIVAKNACPRKGSPRCNATSVMRTSIEWIENVRLFVSQFFVMTRLGSEKTSCLASPNLAVDNPATAGHAMAFSLQNAKVFALIRSGFITSALLWHCIFIFVKCKQIVHKQTVQRSPKNGGRHTSADIGGRKFRANALAIGDDSDADTAD